MKHILSKHLLLCIVSLLIFALGVPLTTQHAFAEASVKDGDYIQFGSYNNQPIIWRVIDFDKEGNPLIFSSKAICEKAYDADHLGDNDYGYGKGNWEDSNIRAWLNSDAPAGSVIYPCGNPPNDANLMSALFVNQGETDPKNYDLESGFLSDNNFSAFERSLIKEVTQKTVISSVGKNRADGGTAEYKMSVFNQEEGYYIKDAILNYDTAYYENVTDKVFFLDLKQVQSVELKFGDFYKGFWVGTSNIEDYFVRNEDGKAPDLIYFVSAYSDAFGFNGKDPVIFGNAPHFCRGVRPALYLDLGEAALSKGSGTESDPYIISKMVTTAKAVTTTSKVLVNGKPVEFKAYNINGYNYFKLRDLAQAISGTEKQFDVSFDQNKNAINLISAKVYNPVGGELSKGSYDIATAKKTASSLYKDNALKKLDAYNIKGNNYFKLRDIANSFDFYVGWVSDGSTGTINIDTTKSYSDSSKYK